MTRSDLIVVAPWIIFAVCLAALCIRLLRARRSAHRSSSPATADAPHGIEDRRARRLSHIRSPHRLHRTRMTVACT